MHVTYIVFTQFCPERGKVNTSKRKKNIPNMAPGGRQPKRVRASRGTDLESARASQRLAKRVATEATNGLNEEESTTVNAEIPQSSTAATAEDNVHGGQNMSSDDQDNLAADQDNTVPVEDNLAGDQDNQDNEGML
jgi:hypothetical protein